MVTLNRIVAVAMVDGPGAALAELTAAEADPALAGHHRVHAVRAHLLDLPATGRRPGGLPAGRPATLSVPEQRYLRLRATQRT